MSAHSIVNLFIDKSLSSSIVLVIEASDESWNEIHETARTLVNKYPGVFTRLFFLGANRNDRISGATKFADTLTRLFGLNKNRISLIGPIYELLEDESFSGEIAVVCEYLPVDLADWHTTDILSRSLFISTEEPSPEHEIRHVLPTGNIANQLRNPVKEISIKGNGFVPLRWGTPIDMIGEAACEDGSFCVRISPEKENIELHIQALITGTQLPQIHLARVRGTSAETISFEQEKSPWFDTQRWPAIPEKILPIIKAKRKGVPFQCPQCGNEHPSATHSCPFGGSVFQGLTQKSCLLFSHNNHLDLSQVYAYVLPDSGKVITRQGLIYQPSDTGWVMVRSIRGFEEVTNDIWAVLNPI